MIGRELIYNSAGYVKKGTFLAWTLQHNKPAALVEDENGTVQIAFVEQGITFNPEEEPECSFWESFS